MPRVLSVLCQNGGRAAHLRATRVAKALEHRQSGDGAPARGRDDALGSGGNLIAPVDADAPRSISVVVPVYQAAWSIGDTLRSILAQTMPVREIVIVNDGSTDDLHQAVAEAAGGDERIRIIGQENRGLAAARNRGLNEASGDYVAFLDADDIWHPRFLELTSRHLDENPAAPFAYAYSFRFDVHNRAIRPVPWRRRPERSVIGLLTLNSVGNGSAALFRRQLVNSLGGFDQAPQGAGEQGAEDWKLILGLAAQGEPALVPRPLVGYRYASEGMSQSAPLRQLAAVQRVIAEVRDEMPDIPERHFADANTMMTGWLLPALVNRTDPATVARLVIDAYVRNPGWIRSSDLRHLHARKLTEIARRALSRLIPALGPQPLADLVDEGERPYQFLEGSLTPANSLAITASAGKRAPDATPQTAGPRRPPWTMSLS
ncbi:MAG: glycosyltransferase family 2 protein [Novosphingobium sp.]